MKQLRSCLSFVSGTIVVLLLLFVFVGPAVYTELAGTSVAGVITDRREEIRVRYGEWRRRLHLEVRYTPANAVEPKVAFIPVSMARYDRARIGDAVEVRSVPQHDMRALDAIAAPRLLDQGPLGQLRADFGSSSLAVALAILTVFLLAGWSAKRRGWMALPFFVLLFGFLMYTVSDPPRPTPPGPQRSTQATVRLVSVIDRLSWGTGRHSRGDFGDEALQFYDVVALEFVPEGRAGAVVGVDLVDVGSVPGLAVGANVPITYSLTDPRWVRIEGAQRTYFWKNLYGYAIFVGLMLIVAVIIQIIRRRKRIRPQRLPLS